MIPNPLFLLRMGTLLGSATCHLVTADPRGFAGKVAERIRLADGAISRLPTGWLRKYAAGQNTQARELISAGHLTEGIRVAAQRGSSSDLHLARRTLERLELLETVPPTNTYVAGGGEHRLLHVLTNSKPFTNSGYTVRSHHVLECQQAAGIEVRAVTRLGYPVLVGKIPTSIEQRIGEITYRRLLPWLYPASLKDRNKLAVDMIVAEAREMGATILHTTTDYMNAVVVAEAAKQLEIPWVYEVRGELESTWLSRQSEAQQKEAEDSEFYRLARAAETRCMNAASAVVALSEVSKQQLLERGVPAEKISVVPNAVDEAEIGRSFDRKAIRRELGLDEHARIVGTVTAVVDYEGLDSLIAAVKHLPEDFIVLIVGDGAARPRLEQFAENLGVADRVVFAGRQPSEDIWRWYAALDVFAMPRKDTKVTRAVTPIKPLTAMALDIPVVASDLPALREVTGERAEYVIPGDPRSLAGGITDVSKEPHQGGPQWVDQRTWRRNSQRYRELYDNIAGQPQ